MILATTVNPNAAEMGQWALIRQPPLPRSSELRKKVTQRA